MENQEEASLGTLQEEAKQIGVEIRNAAMALSLSSENVSVSVQ